MADSSDIWDLGRSALMAGRTKDEGVMYLSHEKSNYGRLQKTILFSVTDTGIEFKGTSKKKDRDYVSELYGYPASNEMLRDHNMLIFWSGAIESREEPIVVSQPCSSIDIIPTVLNLMGADFDSRLYPGRDLLSTDEGLVMWNSYSWKTEKGFYDSTTGRFTPAEGQQADSDYIDSVKEIVRDKLNYCRNVIEKDYFSYVFPE